MSNAEINLIALTVARALNLEYLMGTNWIEWHKSNGKEIKKTFENTFELKCYLEGVLLAIRLS